MAIVNKGNVFSIGKADEYNLGGPGDRSGTMTIGLLSVSFSGSITVTGRAKGQAAFVAIPYTSLHVNGAVGTGAQVTTAITTTSLIQVRVADGMEVALLVTYSSGAMEVVVVPTAGTT